MRAKVFSARQLPQQPHRPGPSWARLSPDLPKKVTMLVHYSSVKSSRKGSSVALKR